MEIQYKTKELQKCAEQPGYAQRKVGMEQAKSFCVASMYCWGPTVLRI